jgi:hypothetical protein
MCHNTVCSERSMSERIHIIKAHIASLSQLFIYDYMTFVDENSTFVDKMHKINTTDLLIFGE